MYSNWEIVKCAWGIVVNNNHVALIRMTRVEWWSFPKWLIEENETSLEAWAREIYEETGLKDISLVRELDILSRPGADGSPVLLDIYMYLFNSNQENIKPIDTYVPEAKWIHIDEVENYLTLTEEKKYFHSIKKLIQ